MEPTIPDIQELRKLFFQKTQEENKDFHSKDVSRVINDENWLTRFLLHHDSDIEGALSMLIDTCEWRKNNKVNEINEDTINMEYLTEGSLFVHNKDKDGKYLFIFKCAKHFKGQKDFEELKRIVIYWMERMERQTKGDQITIFFDMLGSGLSNMDMEYTQYIISLFKLYYPHFLNYILIFEMPWVLNAAFKIIKSWLPAKAVQKIRFVDKKSLKEYVENSQALKSWGGQDTFEYTFVPEASETGKLEENKKKWISIEISVCAHLVGRTYHHILVNLVPPPQHEFLCIYGSVLLFSVIVSYLISYYFTFLYYLRFLLKELFSPHSALTSFHCCPPWNRCVIKKEVNSNSLPIVVHFADGSPDIEVANNAFGDTKHDESSSSRITVYPSDAIIFNQEGIELSGTLTISNTSEMNTIYKVKTTSPEKFRVRPSCGLLASGSSIAINMVLLSGYTGANILRDKFLVMSYPVEQNNTPSTDLNEMWKQLSQDSKKLEEHRVRCRVPSIQNVANHNGGPVPSSPTPTSEIEQKISQLLISMNHLTECHTKMESDLHSLRRLFLFIAVVVLLCGVAVVFLMRPPTSTMGSFSSSGLPGYCHPFQSPSLPVEDK